MKKRLIITMSIATLLIFGLVMHLQGEQPAANAESENSYHLVTFNQAVNGDKVIQRFNGLEVTMHQLVHEFKPTVGVEQQGGYRPYVDSSVATLIKNYRKEYTGFLDTKIKREKQIIEAGNTKYLKGHKKLLEAFMERKQAYKENGIPIIALYMRAQPNTIEKIQQMPEVQEIRKVNSLTQVPEKSRNQ